jgi:hypothetical protein
MIIDIFSYKIYKTKLTFKYKKELINIINNISGENQVEVRNKNVTNGKIFDFIENDEKFEYNGKNIINILSSEIEKKLSLFSKSINLNKELLISNFWCVSYQENQKCIPHTHSSSPEYLFSGIYNLSFDKNSHCGTTYYNDESLKKSITPFCEEDDLFIYPANVYHGYGGSNSEKKRIVLPFDIICKNLIKFSYE